MIQVKCGFTTQVSMYVAILKVTKKSIYQPRSYFWALKTKFVSVVSFKYFMPTRSHSLGKHVFTPVDWIQIKVSNLSLNVRTIVESPLALSRESIIKGGFQSWKVFSIMKKQLVHWQLLGNPISITLASQGALVRRFKGWDKQGYFSMREKVYDLTMHAVKCVLSQIVMGLLQWSRSTGHNVIAVAFHHLQACNAEQAFSLCLRQAQWCCDESGKDDLLVEGRDSGAEEYIVSTLIYAVHMD